MRAVIFDFGNVVIDWDPWRLFKTVFATREEYETYLVEARFFEGLDRTDCGETFESWLKDMETYASHYVPHTRAYFERFMESITGLNPGTVDIVRRLKAAKVPIYGLTNWSHEMFPLARQAHDIFEAFDGILVSGEEKLIKPDPRIFELAIARFNLEPRETIFIDDRRVNVEAAEKVGLVGHHFTSADLLREDLRRRGFECMTT